MEWRAKFGWPRGGEARTSAAGAIAVPRRGPCSVRSASQPLEFSQLFRLKRPVKRTVESVTLLGLFRWTRPGGAAWRRGGADRGCQSASLAWPRQAAAGRGGPRRAGVARCRQLSRRKGLQSRVAAWRRGRARGGCATRLCWLCFSCGAKQDCDSIKRVLLCMKGVRLLARRGSIQSGVEWWQTRAGRGGTDRPPRPASPLSTGDFSPGNWFSLSV